MPLQETVSEKNSAPARAYQTLTESLRERITRGEWSAGSMLPSRAGLAREYGVSLTTVQQAISRLIGEDVLYADGGRGTFVARAARTEPAPLYPRSHALGLPTDSPILGIVESSSLPMHAARAHSHGWIDIIATQLEATFQNVGGRTLCYDAPDDLEVSLETAVDALMSERIDGLAIIGVFDEDDSILALKTLLQERHIPAVYVSWRELPFPFPHVFYDSYMAGYEAADHLRRCGYGPITFFGYEARPWSEQRLAGARAAVGRGLQQAFTISGAAAQEGAARLIALDREIDRLLENPLADPAARWGIIADNDLLAMELQDIISARGLTAGRDFGLVGFDNHPSLRSRGLTTMRPPLEALGETAAQMLLNQIRGDKSCLQTRLRSQLLPRASTRRS